MELKDHIIVITVFHVATKQIVLLDTYLITSLVKWSAYTAQLLCVFVTF